VVLAVADGAAVLFAMNAFRDTQRHQIDTLYSDLTNERGQH
jgi:hypothetical protein